MGLNVHEKALQIANEEWLGLGDTSNLAIANPFLNMSREDRENPHIHLLSILRQPQFFGFTCQVLLNKTLAPFQMACLTELWNRSFPMLIGCRGMGKSFLLGLYALLRALFCQGTKVVIVGAGFRQAKFVFEYCETIWRNAPLLQDICGGSSRNGPKRDVDRCVFRIGDSDITAVPLGDGSRIRGQRANVLLSDEFASIPQLTFETTVEPFAAVSAEPILKLREAARIKAYKRMGLWSDEQEFETGSGLLSNQSIISGTAYYAFNSFYSYWRKWQSIVESRGDLNKLEEIFRGEVPPKFKWKDYSVIRLPVELLPEGFLDEKNIIKAKATVHLSQFQMEYSACFATDSNGFFKRSLVESCVVGHPTTPIVQPSCGEVVFNAALKGNPGGRYVIAADPAAESDNFSIVVLELWPDHRRIVYCWTTTRARFKVKLSKGVVQENDFYEFATRKIRDLVTLFPCASLCVDGQGGGVAVIETLGDPTKLKKGERPIYPVINFDEPKDTDNKAGEHLLSVIQFARAEYVTQANHGLRKDLEDKAILFPQFDAALLAIALEQDKSVGRTTSDDEKLYDTLEDAMTEIEELKDELATVVHTQTGSSLRDRFDVPEVKLVGGRKGRLRKDRYSALLMANMAARIIQREPVNIAPEVHGGFARVLAAGRKRGDRAGPAWTNPPFYQDAVGDGSTFGAVVKRGRPD